jgi:hypothetical protein
MRTSQRRLRLGRLAGLSAVVAAVLATLSLVDASAAVERCPGGGPLVVNAFATFRNLADFGADGHVWVKGAIIRVASQAAPR